jgi:DNA-binding HxlR family transcriptional regulator
MKQEFADWPCSVARAAGVFGDSWTLLILRDAMYGLTRYDEFQRSLHIARNTLSDRLGKLVDAGVMTKRFYQDNPPRYEYLLTEMGRDFFPVLAAMLSWGDKWLDGGGGAPVTLCHHGDGHGIVSRVICEQGGDPVGHEDIRFCVGPGYPDDVRPEICGAGSSRLRVRPGAARRPRVARGPARRAGAPAESSCRGIASLTSQTPSVTKRDAQRPPSGARLSPAPSTGAGARRLRRPDLAATHCGDRSPHGYSLSFSD